MRLQESLITRRQEFRPNNGPRSWESSYRPRTQMRWIHAPTEPVPILKTKDLKAAPAPPKKIQINSDKKGAVSPVTNKVTWPKIALISPGRIKARSRHALPRPKPGIATTLQP